MLLRWGKRGVRTMAAVMVTAGALTAVPAVAGASAFSSAEASAGSGSRVSAELAAASRCDPVWFIGARGSGESTGANYGYSGMGAPVSYMAQVIAGDLKAKGLAMGYKAVESYKSVDYPAVSVDVLMPNKAVLALVVAGHLVDAAALYADTSVAPFDASMDKGIVVTEADVASVLAACPDAKLILGGYSQGATAVHDAENWLAENKPAEYKHIAGTLLLGDPDRVQDTRDKTFGTAPRDAEGLRVWLHLVRPHEVPSPADTAEIANTDDIIGDFAFSHVDTISRFERARHVHTSYTSTAKNRQILASAATWVAGKVPGFSFSDAAIRFASTAYGTIPAGVTTSEQLAAVGGVAPYSYGIDSLDYPKTPDWVTLTPAGKLTISPPAGTKGSYSFRVYATDHAGKTSKLTAVTFSVAPVQSWTEDSVPLPANASSDQEAGSGVKGVSCPSASVCVAVGTYSDTSGTPQGLLLTWSAAAGWTTEQAPLPAGAVSGSLSQVSCPSVSFCTAVGWYSSDAGNVGMVLTWNGSTWTAAQAPIPADAVSEGAGYEIQPQGVSCPSVSFCTAVGEYESASADGLYRPLLLTWSGGSWTATEAAFPASASEANIGLSAVSCASVSSCAAVGAIAPSSSGGLLLTWSGGAWSAEAYSDPGVLLQSVSCASASFCTAAGAYLTPADVQTGLLLTWSGGSWTPLQAPLPGTGDTGAQITGVSCPTTSLCTAVGSYGDASAPENGLILSGADGTWTPAPTPAADSNLGYSGVSCLSSGFCAIVGGMLLTSSG